MPDLSKNVLYYGTDNPLPQAVHLRAGALRMVYENGDLRYVRLGEHEIIRRLYAAVRDHNWGTVPMVITDEVIEAESDSFEITYTAVHRAPDLDIHFSWDGRIVGAADGTVTFTFDGKAHTDFQRNRIGFCVLHPMALAGQPCAVEYADGSNAMGMFPKLISPHQPFKNMKAITQTVVPGLQAEIRFEGDVFEMEDQRNWTDASYKTYCTPLELPFPVAVKAGDTVQQSVTLTLHGEMPEVDDTVKPLTVRVGEEKGAVMPPLGLCVASHDEPLSENAIRQLKKMGLRHLRVDLHLKHEVAARLRRAWDEAKAIDAALEVALHVTEAADAQLAAFRETLDAMQPEVWAFIVYHEGEKSTPKQTVDIARKHLAGYGKAKVGAGTDAFFTELNRERPPTEVVDFVAYSTNPQVHAFDNASLTETMAAHAPTVETALSFSNGKPVVVSPVTLYMRWNPNATGDAPETPPGELPQRVDPRQMSLFGGGWTLGSVKYLTEGGASSLTYYETTGWLGVMEREAGSPVPERFQSKPGAVFPVYYVLRSLCEGVGGEVLACESSQPLTVDAMAFRKDGRKGMMMANYTERKQKVTIMGLRGTARVWTLNEENIEKAMDTPIGFYSREAALIDAKPEGFTVELLPFAVTTMYSDNDK